MFFFFNDTATTEIYTLSLHDALPISEYEKWRKKVRLASDFREFIYTSVKVTPAEIISYYLSKDGKIKDFNKEKGKYIKELAQQKFLNIMNYYLQSITAKTEIKSYLKERESGR